MSEVMTREELEARFDSEWVLLEDPEVDEQSRVVRGRVVCHSKDRDEVYRKAIARLCQMQIQTAGTRLLTRTLRAARRGEPETASKAPKSAAGRGPAACHRRAATDAVSRAVERFAEAVVFRPAREWI